MAAKKFLINKKTGQEFPTSDPDAVIKRFPQTFKRKPDTKLNEDILKKDSDVQKSTNETNVVDAEIIKVENTKPTQSRKKDKK